MNPRNKRLEQEVRDARVWHDARLDRTIARLVDRTDADGRTELLILQHERRIRRAREVVNARFAS